MTVNSEENDLFLQEMGDITPIRLEKRVANRRHNPSDLISEARRKNAIQDVEKDENHLVGDHVELLDPYYTLEFKRSGVQNGVFRKLKQGKYPQDARLDLHRLSVESARKEVYSFIKTAMAYDVRSLIIIHGNGSHGTSESAILKSYVHKWLPDMEEVQAYCSAQKHHGGVGAVYVLLKKSENKKQQNREKISRGRIDL
ncbi:MAG: DNA-nicking Smr family endonuclease [Oceanicoccus sp.]|jgi:DNA-nicking Smr family endonuclease